MNNKIKHFGVERKYNYHVNTFKRSYKRQILHEQTIL